MLFGAILFLRCKRLKQSVLLHPNYSIYVLIKGENWLKRMRFKLDVSGKKKIGRKLAIEIRGSGFPLNACGNDTSG